MSIFVLKTVVKKFCQVESYLNWFSKIIYIMASCQIKNNSNELFLRIKQNRIYILKYSNIKLSVN